MPLSDETQLGTYLKNRRTRLDPVAFGFPLARRRTPGLRREEVAQRASVSATWYTWLEQGRGGAPSADVLERISRALMLTEVEREHLFLLGLGRPPEVRYQLTEGVTPRLQHLLDVLELSPAIVKNVTWDVMAWNRAAQADWQSVARFVVAAFRADAARAGASRNAQALVDELSQQSVEFAAMWRDNDVRSHGEGTKHIRHARAGLLAFEYSAFGIDGRPDLSMVVYNPATAADATRIRALLSPMKPSGPRPSRAPRQQ